MMSRFVRSRKNISVTCVYRSADSCTMMLTTVTMMPRTAAIIDDSEPSASVILSDW
jgi:hypothetical protein